MKEQKPEQQYKKVKGFHKDKKRHKNQVHKILWESHVSAATRPIYVTQVPLYVIPTSATCLAYTVILVPVFCEVAFHHFIYTIHINKVDIAIDNENVDKHGPYNDPVKYGPFPTISK